LALLLSATLVIALHALPAYPEGITIGLRAGLSIPTLTEPADPNPLTTGYDSRLGPDFGVSVELPVSSTFSLVPMVRFSTQGGRKKGLQALPTPNEAVPLFPAGHAPTYVYADYKGVTKLDYLLVPVLAKASKQVGRTPFRANLAAGPFAGFLLSAHQVTSGTSTLYVDPAALQPLPGGPQALDADVDIKNDLHTFNYGFEASIGATYERGRHAFTFEVGLNYGLLGIQKNVDGKNNTQATIVAVEYGYRFGK
jgi:hypothetical protein